MDIETGKEFRIFSGHTSTVYSANFTTDGRYILTGSHDNSLKLWDIATGQEIATLIPIDSADWTVVTPSGLFDASQGAEKLLYYVAGNEIIELNQLKARYYQPGLLKILLGYGDEELRVVPSSNYIRLYPEVKISPIDNNKPELKLKLINSGGGIGPVSVYIDNIQVIEEARQSVADSSANELDIIINLLQENFVQYYKFKDVNIIKVVVQNAEEYLISRGDTVNFIPSVNMIKDKDYLSKQAKKTAEDYKIHLYGLFAGISNYKGDDIDLYYASDDAKDISNAISAGAKNLYGEKNVSIELLNDD